MEREREGRERKKGRDGIGEGEEKENGDRPPTIFDLEVALRFCVPSGFISRYVHARLQVSVCSGYDLCCPG